MSRFENATIIKAANVYFEGKVSSRTVLLSGTEQAEVMEIMAGKLTVRLPGSETWQSIQGGESFAVPANSRFSLQVQELTDYCCSYIG
jgi:uncharacterized protein YaiE (UPF0345 family)